jgi:hypothetical protein
LEKQFHVSQLQEGTRKILLASLDVSEIRLLTYKTPFDGKSGF